MIGDKNNPYYNSSGYPDPTAYDAISAATREEAETDEKVRNLIKVLKYTIDLAGFDLVARIEVRHRKSGKIYK